MLNVYGSSKGAKSAKKCAKTCVFGFDAAKCGACGERVEDRKLKVERSGLDDAKGHQGRKGPEGRKGLGICLPGHFRRCHELKVGRPRKGGVLVAAIPEGKLSENRKRMLSQDRIPFSLSDFFKRTCNPLESGK